MDSRRQHEQHEREHTGKKPKHNYRRPTAESVDDYSDTSPPLASGEFKRTHVEHENHQPPLAGSGHPQYQSYRMDNPAQTLPHTRQPSNTHELGELDPTPDPPEDKSSHGVKGKSVSFNPHVETHTIPAREEPRSVHFDPVNTDHGSGSIAMIYQNSESHPNEHSDRYDVNKKAPMTPMLDKHGDFLQRYQ